MCIEFENSREGQGYSLRVNKRMVLTLVGVHALTQGVRLGRGKEYYVFMSEHTDE